MNYCITNLLKDRVLLYLLFDINNNSCYCISVLIQKEENMQELLRINNVSKKYGHFKALDNVSLNLQAGRIIGLLGLMVLGKQH